MIETIVFAFGIGLGICTVIVIQKVYDWVDNLASRVQSLKWELSRYSIEREMWYEFHDWKRMKEGKQ